MPERTSDPELFATPLTDTGRSDTAVALPPAPLVPRIDLPRRIALGQVMAHLALAALLACCAAVVVFAASGPTALVWHSEVAFPGWVAGPLHGLFGRLPHRVDTLTFGFLMMNLGMLVAYGVALRLAGTLSMSAVWIFVVAAHVILLIGPPLQATDIFNYLGYARLEALHGLNPYTHVIAAESGDPISLFASWHHWQSPYGPLFSALTYPLGLMPLHAAFWVFKVAAIAMGLVLLWLVSRCARLTGRDPRSAVLFVAANPLFMIDEVGGFHNDVFMIVAAMGAIWFLLSGRDRSAGAATAVAVSVKYTAGLILPFLLLAAPSLRRRVNVAGGVVLAGVPLLVLTVALFGLALPNLAEQGSILTAFSVPNLLGWGLGLGGATPGLLKAGELFVVAVVVLQLRRNRDWVAGAGWATAALLVSLGWIWPWYVVWLLPLAAIASSARLRAVAVALTVFLVITTAPYTMRLLAAHGINPLSGPPGVRSAAIALHFER